MAPQWVYFGGAASCVLSGGLLLAVAPESVGELLRALETGGAPAHAVIGEVVDGPPGHLEVLAS